MKFFLSLLRDKRGVSSLEYAILAGVVIVGLSAALGTTNATGLRGTIGTAFTNISTQVTTATK